MKQTRLAKKEAQELWVYETQKYWHQVKNSPNNTSIPENEYRLISHAPRDFFSEIHNFNECPSEEYILSLRDLYLTFRKNSRKVTNKKQTHSDKLECDNNPLKNFTDDQIFCEAKRRGAKIQVLMYCDY